MNTSQNARDERDKSNKMLGNMGMKSEELGKGTQQNQPESPIRKAEAAHAAPKKYVNGKEHDGAVEDHSDLVE